MTHNTFNRLHTLRMENDAAGYAMEEMKPRFTALANRHEDGTAPRAVSAFQLFQTPAPIARRLVDALGAVGGRVLEPSAGLGRILDALPGGIAVVAVEQEANLCGELYRQNRAGVQIMQRDFLACDAAILGAFDAVAMNPPFHMRADIAHILHAKTFLKPGGRLAALCFDTPSREKALRHMCTTWEKLPAGTFGKEGTSVSTVLLTIQN